MDEGKIKSLFESLLEKYKSSEECCIYNMSSDIEVEIEELKKEISKFREELYYIFLKNI